MLKITIPGRELWNEKTERFEKFDSCTICLEHSLVSLAKWESKWHKPFLNNKKVTSEEILDYIKFMTITQNVDDSVYMLLTEENIKQIMDYIDDPMTATTINEDKKTGRGRIITNELLYCWMAQCGIWKECEKWHINRLLMLIRVCNAENNPPKKMSKAATAKKYANLNAARRKAMNTKG